MLERNGTMAVKDICKKWENAIKHLAGDLWAIRFAILLVIIYLCLTEQLFHTTCPSVIIFGYPCPGCGLTRGMLHLLKGDFAGAWNDNPSIFLICACVTYGGFFRYYKDRRPPGYTAVIIMTGLLMILIYLFRWATGQIVPTQYQGIIHAVIIFANK